MILSLSTFSFSRRTTDIAAPFDHSHALAFYPYILFNLPETTLLEEWKVTEINRRIDIITRSKYNQTSIILL